MKVLILGIAIFLFLYPLFFPLSLRNFPFPPEGERVEFYVYPGTSFLSLAQELEKRGIIGRSDIFLEELRRNPLVLRAGRYILRKHMSIYDAISALRRKPALEKVVIPEGLTAREIAELFLKRGVISSKDEFLKLVSGGKNLFKFKYARYIPSSSLEGYLFPETYYFPKGASPKSVISVMLRAFERVITTDMLNQLPKLGLKFHQVITLASIVEKEALKPREYPLIAAVFYNRLKRGMKLQSCATVEYLLPERKKRLALKDLKIDSPYNTYVHKGLPPGPICNPGERAIRAAFFPAKVNYLYFVSKGNGEHYFSRTYKEHVRAKAKYLRKTR